MRLGLVLLIASIGAVGMWSVVVSLPVVQAEFAATRGAVSLAFTMTMIPYAVVSSEPSGTRTRALTTPVRTTTANSHTAALA